MAEILHTSDTHLGYTQYNLPEREEDFFDVFVQVIDDAIEKDVDAVVHAGDLFQSSRPDPSVLIPTIDELQRLDEADIPFLIVVGNHDETADEQWVDLLKKVGVAEHLGEDPIVIDNTAFYGLDYVSPARRTQLDYQFEEHNADYAALVAHGLMQPLSHSQWEAQEIIAQSNIQFDALLLGDDHKPNRTMVENTIMTYPGSTERTDTGQKADRGYNLVTFEEDAYNPEDEDAHPVDVTREYLDTREFLYLEEELEEGDDVSVLRERIDNEDLEGTVTVLEVFGGGEPILHAPVEEYAEQAGALTLRFHDRRELEEEGYEAEVQFADPETAIEKRIREKGLSAPAYDLEKMVRRKDVPKSKMTQTAEDEIDDLIDDDPEQFDVSADLEPLADDDETESGSEDDTAEDTPEETVGEDMNSDEQGGVDEAPASEAKDEWDDHFSSQGTDEQQNEENESTGDGEDSSEEEEELASTEESQQTGFSDF